MPEFRLTPTGHLRWESAEDQAEPSRLTLLRKLFSVGWRQGRFTLAAEKMDTGDSLTLRYWQGVAERCLAVPCHIPESADRIEVEPPSPGGCATWVLTAPPKRGGEYLRFIREFRERRRES